MLLNCDVSGTQREQKDKVKEGNVKERRRESERADVWNQLVVFTLSAGRFAGLLKRRVVAEV